MNTHDPIPPEYRGWWRITETLQSMNDGLDIHRARPALDHRPLRRLARAAALDERLHLRQQLR
jgi:hypothetical protein